MSAAAAAAAMVAAGTVRASFGQAGARRGIPGPMVVLMVVVMPPAFSEVDGPNDYGGSDHSNRAENHKKALQRTAERMP